MPGKRKTLVVLPAYNEADVISGTVSGLKEAVDADILVVDDGSGDGTGDAAVEAGARVVRHPVNLGLGAALETGFEAARQGGYERLVTFDSDGQHNPDDALKLLRELDGCDMVVGVRKVMFDRMPFAKKVGNAVLNMMTAFIFGVSSSDSQSGLRALNRRAFEAIHLRARGYECSSEILYEAKRAGLRITEVPVDVIYTEHSMRKGTGVSDGFRIFWRMILHERGD